MKITDLDDNYPFDNYILADLMSNRKKKVSTDQKTTPFGNAQLSAGASELLKKLMLDFKSKLPPEERIYSKKYNASLIYNLFKGEYQFSYEQCKEVYDALCACT